MRTPSAGRLDDAAWLPEALQAAGAAALLWDIDADLLRCSPSMASLLGGDAAALLPDYHRFLQQLHPDDRSAVHSQLQRAVAEGGRVDLQFRLRRLDGTELWLHCAGAVLVGGAPPRRRLCGCLADIASLKQAEAQQLQAQKLDSTGLLAGGIAHDFHNLLALLDGELQQARRLLPTGSPPLAAIERALQATARGQQLLQRLLQFARRQELHVQSFAAEQLLLDAEPRLRQALGAAIELQLRLQPPIGSVRADRAQVEAVLLQLCSNAQRALPRGGSVRLTLDQLQLRPGQRPPQHGVAPGRWVRIAFADDGLGMDAAVRARAFEPFFTTRIDAPGLGLSTCHGIVRQLGGHIWVDSTPGRGTTFTILLPPGEVLIERPPIPAELAEPVRVLLVDDDDPLRAVLTGALRAEGYQVLAAASGREALELAERVEGGIAVLITDLVMPGIGGVDLAERLQRRRPGIRVLYITGYREQLIELLDQHETAAVLAKPFTAAELIGRVQDLVQQEGRRQPAGS